jgi:Tol biopolymer transport system component
VDGGPTVVYSAEAHGNLTSALSKVPVSSNSAPTPFMPRTDEKKMGAWASDLSASRDGRLITFLSDRETPYAYDVFLAVSSGADLKALHITNLAKYNSSPVIAPDGKSVYFLAGTDSNAHARAIYSLYRTDLQGNAIKLADSTLFTDPAQWNGRAP